MKFNLLSKVISSTEYNNRWNVKIIEGFPFEKRINEHFWNKCNFSYNVYNLFIQKLRKCEI